MVQLIYRGIDGRSKILEYDGSKVEADELYEMFAEKEALPLGSFHLYHNNKSIVNCMESINREGNVSSLIPVTLHPLLVGGKGGFGSMLRAIGAQIEKTTNKEACRDLSGRRLRDINAEKRFKDWVSKQANAQEEKDKKRKEKLEKLKQEPKIMFEDPNYFKSKEDIPQEVDEALEHGLKNEIINQSESSKRKDPFDKDDSIKKQKKSLWLGVDLSDDDSEFDDDSDREKDKSQDKTDLQTGTKAEMSNEVKISQVSSDSPIPSTSSENSQQTSDCDLPALGLGSSQIVVNHA